jgi:hypothetical protein
MQARENEVPPIVHQALRSPGQSLDAATRAFFEPLYGQNFSRVRVHTDVSAAESARAVDALAYTVGQDIVFGSNQYHPGTTSGNRLLAHELTHVTQQRSRGASTGPLEIGSTEANEEREAQSAEALVESRINYQGLSAPNESPILRRQPTKPPATAPAAKPAFSCLQEATGKDANLAAGTVTVIEYGFEGCDGCKLLQPVLDQICYNYKTNSKFKVNIFSVDALKPEAAKSSPAVPANISTYPTTLVFSGTTETARFTGGTVAPIDIYKAINDAASKTSSPATTTPTTTPQTPTKTPPTTTPTTPTTTPTTPTTTPSTGQPCSFNIVGIDGKDSFDDTRKFTDDEIAKDIDGIRKKINNTTATADQLRKQTANCQLQTYQLVSNEQSARILHVAWRKSPPAGTLSVLRAAIDDGGDQPPGKVASVSTLNPKTNPLPSGCSAPKLPDKPAWCVPFCSFGEFLMEVSVAYECDPPGSKQINTLKFGPKKITLSEKKP